MSERWGSHWRWRCLLAAIFFGLLASMYAVAEQWVVRKLIPSHSSPAVVRVIGRSGGWLEAWSWTTGKRWKIANLSPEIVQGETEETLRVIQNGTAVSWQRGPDLHLVELISPHQVETFRIPLDTSVHKFIGTSADLHYAAYQATGKVKRDGSVMLTADFQGGPDRDIYVLTMVDLRTGEISDKHLWESSSSPSRELGQFKSIRPLTPSPRDLDEPPLSRWTISAEGKWQQLERLNIRPDTHLFAMKGKGRDWQLTDGPATQLSPQVVWMDIDEESVSGTRLLVRHSSEPLAFTVDRESNAIRPLETPGQFFIAAAFVDDETLVLSDLRDDIRVIDAKSGKLIALESSGSQRRGRIAVVGVGLALMAVLWCVVVLSEQALFWGLVDSLVVCVTVQMFLVAILIASSQPYMGSIPDLDHALVFVIHCFVAASNAGAATIAGWYWSHGRGWLLSRWLFGLAWLSISAVPAVVALHFLDLRSGSFLSLFGTFVAFSVLLAGLTSVLVAGIRSLGWTIHDTPIHEVPTRFGLATCFAAISAVAILIPIGQSFYGGISYADALIVSGMGLGVAAVGIGIVANLFSRASRYVQAAVWALLVAATVAGAIALARYVPPLDPEWLLYVLEASAIAGVVFAMMLPCLVVRAHGWHWVRTVKAADKVGPAPQLQTS